MKIKTAFLNEIFLNNYSVDKYSKAFLNLKVVIDLERKDSDKIPNEIIKSFDRLEKKYYNFINGIPLKVIEYYFYKNRDNFNTMPYIEYYNKNIDNLKVMDLYLMLEEFFKDVYLIAGNIANFYSLEMKINKNEEQFI